MKLKDLIPPALFRLYAGYRIYKGPYASWSEAVKISKKNPQSNMLKRVARSTHNIINGQSAYERDSVEFDHIEYSWPLLSGLLFAALLNKNSLRVLDFGGSLGTTYYQNRLFLNKIPSLQWGIIEQPDYIEYGKKNLKQQKTKFYSTLSECVEKMKPNVVIFGSVLQYLAQPYETIREVCNVVNPSLIIVDRTPMTDKNESVYVQHVPKKIYSGSFPYWVLNEEKLLDAFNKSHYELLELYTCDFLSSFNFVFKGYIFLRSS